jgi:hypothetical protein
VGHSKEDATTGDALTRDVFLITSGIMNDYGVFDLGQRLDQLLGSIASVRSVMPGSHIVCIDGSIPDMPSRIQDRIRDTGVQFVKVPQDKANQESKDVDANQFMAKVFGELNIWYHFFHTVGIDPKTYQRVHKLSGRYQLLDTYREHDFDQCNVLIAKPYTWYKGPWAPGETESSYPTRCWSWHTDLWHAIEMTWQNIAADTKNYLEKQGLIRVTEAALYENLHRLMLPCTEVERMWVQGHFGQDGRFIQD